MWSAVFTNLIDRHQNLVSAIRWWLLGGDVLATWMVGVGILWESQSLNINHHAARRFVLIGVVLETLCSVGLFWFDDNISDAQLSKIAMLEARLAPRAITPEQQHHLSTIAAEFPGQKFEGAVAAGITDGNALWATLYPPLAEHWRFVAPSSMGFGNPPTAIPIDPEPDVAIHVPPEAPPQTQAAAVALVKELRADDIWANAVEGAFGDSDKDSTVIVIEIGPKTR